MLEGTRRQSRGAPASPPGGCARSCCAGGGVEEAVDVVAHRDVDGQHHERDERQRLADGLAEDAGDSRTKKITGGEQASAQRRCARSAGTPRRDLGRCRRALGARLLRLGAGARPAAAVDRAALGAAVLAAALRFV